MIDPCLLLELSLLILQQFLNWNFSNQLSSGYDYMYYASAQHGYFQVKLPYYFIAEVPSNTLLNLPFKCYEELKGLFMLSNEFLICCEEYMEC